MSTSDDRAQRAEEITQEKRSLIVSAQTMHESGRSNAWIAEALNISESQVRKLVVNWGYNCLTKGVHHGRPETIWNIPLHYAATVIFRRDVLQELVISRIYNDAMQYVELSPFVQKETDASMTITKEWADLVKKYAEETYLSKIQHKVGEISKYYKSAGWELEQQESARRVTENKLNPGYEPLHPHDSINMLCRIIGVSASIQASRELSDK